MGEGQLKNLEYEAGASNPMTSKGRCINMRDEISG